MQHYPNQDHYEREPLDPAYDNRYDTPTRRPAYNEYTQSSPYYDDSPQRRAEPYTPHYEQSRYDNMPGIEDGPPPPPPHANLHSSNSSASRHHADDYRGGAPNITPGADNFGPAAAGGIPGIAHNVADRNPRESGMDSLRSTGQVLPPPSRAQYQNSGRSNSSPRHSVHSGPYVGGHAIDGDSRSSVNPFGTVASSVGSRSPSRSPHVSGEPYGSTEDVYYNYSATPRGDGHSLGVVDPMSIEDDGDDGLHYGPRSHRNSGNSSNKRGAAAAIGAAAGGATAVTGEHDTRGYYEPPKRERSSDWLEKKQGRSKRWKWAIIVLIFLVIAGAIVGGVVGTIVTGRKDDNKKSPSDDNKGDLSISSDEIKKLLNNPNLHKVFPGMDYTPINVQYPACVDNPPSQNNVTRDVAVLSQLTNKIRLYGTDCNQTQMVLHAIDKLDMKKDLKVWLGVWQDGNSTTNERQLSQMWDIFDQYGGDQFEGVIVANEILFRKEMTITKLSSILTDVRSNLTKRGIDLPVATSDLGDDWTAELGKDSDLIMANIHPFFSGTPADEAAAWTYGFWQDHNSAFWKTDKQKNIISETGWPSAGGSKCPDGVKDCKTPAKAGIDEMNRFMDDWVCQALSNGTNYFWFEAFDEPWKVRFNTGNENWEDKWGLLDVNRNLKNGIKIPDCGGKTAP
ncbi:endo-beta-1,3-glucanase [Akanthomyces lecanii RCEF 1005]|uniref:glucan endo-1,3-beta-D-glucosidase n=1 Tax=Akanthomyces lecanii RCEF 1005 TaxID=1081108 RepID=A0A167YJL6_CORDF|nr:endo-beta-1,3-glucanase [Akanthomyces lecanii RCEF 1005]